MELGATLSTTDKIVFGPILSRRFGLSLGVDVSPGRKCCNFDCLYCELPSAKPVDEITEAPSVDEIVTAVRRRIAEGIQFDVLTVTANGEPTLYRDLSALAKTLRPLLATHQQLLILSNGSTITDPKVREALCYFDIVKLSLDSASAVTFRKIDRPLKPVEPMHLAEGMRLFREIFKGKLVIEIVVVAGVNDKPDEMEAIRELLISISPDRVDLGTIDRPPAYKVKPVPSEKLFEFAKILAPLPVSVIANQSNQNLGLSYSKEEILLTLAHHPLGMHEAKVLLDQASYDQLNSLVKEGLVVQVDVAGTPFYALSPSQRHPNSPTQNLNSKKSLF
ncbi:MAG: radical SAM protein [Campylobacterales bacterium]